MTLRILRAVRRGGMVAVGMVMVMGSAASISSCSWLHFGQDETYDYRKAKVRQQPLDVPPDLSPLPKEERFQLPVGATSAATSGASSAAGAGAASGTGAGAGTAPAAALAAAPAGLVVAPPPAGAHIVRVGNQRWLAVDATPEVAYATVKELWSGMGLAIAVDEPLVGLLETGWSEYRPDVKEDIVRSGLQRVLGAFTSSGERNKYRARIERTAANTAEITITHRGLEEVFTSPANDSTKWQARKPDPELEAVMLQRLALRFVPAHALRVAVAPEVAPAAPAVVPAAGAALSAPVAPTTAAAATEPAAVSVSAPRVHKVTVGGTVTLQMEDTLEHTYRKVGAALDRLGFTIESRSREKGQYAVRYLDPEYEASEREKKNWWDRIFNSEAKIPEQQFQIVASASGPLTVIEVQDKDGRADGSATSRHILDQLLEQLH